MAATKLDREIVRWTINHLLKHGDTDIFPHPFEFKFFRDRIDVVSDAIAKINLSDYRVTNLIESLVPKSRFGFRLGHQLYPMDTILFTAATVTIASDLERGRIPIQEDVAFSYRFDQSADGDIFEKNHKYKDWVSHTVINTLFSDEIAHVIKTDISDFYSRIYHHRLENCLADATNNSPFSKFILRCLKDYRARQSFGLPVGGNAARLLAEIVLDDTDDALKNEGYRHTRYVDDFILFLKDGQDPYGALAYLAEHLATNEGLSLGPLKTRILTAEDYSRETGLETGESDEDATANAVDRLYMKAYADEEVDDSAVAELSAIDLSGELKSELEEDHWDVGKIRILLRALRLTKAKSVVPFIKEQLLALLPVIKDVVLLMDELNKDSPGTFADLGDVIVEIIQQDAAQRLPVVRAWLLEIFIRDIAPISSERLKKLEFLKGTLDLRQLCLARHKARDVNFFRRGKARIDELNSWIQPAFIFGASCLPADEYQVWLGTIRGRLNFPLSNEFCDWAKSTVHSTNASSSSTGSP